MTEKSRLDGVSIKRAELSSPIALELIYALNAELKAQYPEEGATHFRLDPDEVRGDRGAYLIAWRGDAAVGCGAVRRIETAVGELKRMYVIPDERGTGIGLALVLALEAEAKALGLTRLVLETGTRQIAATGLYRKMGFEVIEPFGEYLDSPLSLCMGKDL